MTARLVVLDVTVTDAKGNFVPGAGPVAVYDHRRQDPQTIRSFAGPKMHAMPALSAGKMVVTSSKDLESIGSAPVAILVMDERNTPFLDGAYVRQMVEKYLKAQPTMFVATSAQHRFTVVHDYTQSRADLLEALHKHRNEGDVTSLNTIAQARKDPAPVGLSQVVAPLVQIADSVRDLPGRKNIIWIGYGYPSVPV